MQNYKRVSILQDDDGHWYVVPYELTEDFNDLLFMTSSEYDEDDDRNKLIQEAEDEFINKFSQYMTGGDINLTELYIKYDKG